MSELTAAVRLHFRAWACRYRGRRWYAVGTTDEGESVEAGPAESPAEALAGLLARRAA